MGTRNTLSDLNNHLFEQLERLNEEDLQGENLEKEIERSKALQGIGKTIVDNGKLILEAHKFNDDRMIDEELPRLLKGE